MRSLRMSTSSSRWLPPEPISPSTRGGDLWGFGQRPFATGLLVGFLPNLWLTFASAMGFAARSLGADAERWTADELRKLPRGSWAVFHDVMLESANVDHVAIGSGRVYAVETKWTSSELPTGT